MQSLKKTQSIINVGMIPQVVGNDIVKEGKKKKKVTLSL
jgi:translation elongation factor P/translation initiation factor 5A